MGVPHAPIGHAPAGNSFGSRVATGGGVGAMGAGVGTMGV